VNKACRERKSAALAFDSDNGDRGWVSRLPLFHGLTELRVWSEYRLVPVEVVTLFSELPAKESHGDRGLSGVSHFEPALDTQLPLTLLAVW
jgi:hypothetical protein